MRQFACFLWSATSWCHVPLASFWELAGDLSDTGMALSVLFVDRTEFWLQNVKPRVLKKNKHMQSVTIFPLVWLHIFPPHLNGKFCRATSVPGTKRRLAYETQKETYGNCTRWSDAMFTISAGTHYRASNFFMVHISIHLQCILPGTSNSEEIYRYSKRMQMTTPCPALRSPSQHNRNS